MAFLLAFAYVLTNCKFYFFYFDVRFKRADEHKSLFLVHLIYSGIYVTGVK